MSSLDKVVEKLKKEQKIPPDTQVITELKKEHIGKTVAFRATIGKTAIKLSPPIKIIEKSDKVREKSFETTLLENDVIFESSYLKVRFKKGTKQPEVLDFFNNAMALFNIVSIPFDFVSISDVIIEMKGLKTKVEALFSSKAHHRGYGLDSVAIEIKEFTNILSAIQFLWGKIRGSDFFKHDNHYQWLGYAMNYLFHGNHFLSFIHSWLFIETSINQLWTKMVNDSFPEEPKVVSRNEWDNFCAPPTSYERNWTTQIKIDELYLRGIIDEVLREKLQTLRNKRNKVLHQEKKREQRIVSLTDSVRAVNVGLSLFNKMIGFDEDKIIAYRKIRAQMDQEVNRGRLFRPTAKQAKK